MVGMGWSGLGCAGVIWHQVRGAETFDLSGKAKARNGKSVMKTHLLEAVVSPEGAHKEGVEGVGEQGGPR